MFKYFTSKPDLRKTTPYPSIRRSERGLEAVDLIAFCLQRLVFPHPGSLVVNNQNLTRVRVILGKLPKPCR